MRIDQRDVKRFAIGAAGLYAAVGLAALVAPGLGLPLVIALTAFLALVVVLVLFLRAWHWFISESFSLIEERSRELRERPPKRRTERR